MGEEFGPYRLESLIGRGGMGEVFRAYDTVKRRTVALATDTGFQTRFRRESEVAARLREPHVIPIHDFGEIDGQLFIDTRLVDGVDLASALSASGPLSAVRAVHIVGKVAGASDAAHADRLVHRDVKLSGPAAYLIDFGIARSTIGTQTTGTAVDTIRHMAPERFLNTDGGDRRSTDWRACCHEALTGRQPFPLRSTNARLSTPERIERYLVLDDAWAPGSPELTPTMKPRRDAVAAPYRPHLDAPVRGCGPMTLG